MDELLQEGREEPMSIWIEENNSVLEEDFIKSFPAEDQPLDDDTSNWINNNCDEFNTFCKKEYLKTEE